MRGQQNGLIGIVGAVQPGQGGDLAFGLLRAGNQPLLPLGMGGDKNAVPRIEGHAIKRIHQRRLKQLLNGRAACGKSHFLVRAVIAHQLVQRGHEGGVFAQFAQGHLHHGNILLQIALDAGAHVQKPRFGKGVRAVY